VQLFKKNRMPIVMLQLPIFPIIYWINEELLVTTFLQPFVVCNRINCIFEIDLFNKDLEL
jgi:hypothetical protein